ncbi:MAG: peptidase, partial [Oscillospiraceae bacterium]|nr:peptidase [Oscillospiraceae bacterium]
RLEYEVEFYAGSMEYEYEINAETGSIISRDIES